MHHTTIPSIPISDPSVAIPNRHSNKVKIGFIYCKRLQKKHQQAIAIRKRYYLPQLERLVRLGIVIERGDGLSQTDQLALLLSLTVVAKRLIGLVQYMHLS